MDAITTLTNAVQLQPTNAQARYNLGTAMERGGYPDQAKQVYEQALSLQPDYPKAREALARMAQPAMPIPRCLCFRTDIPIILKRNTGSKSFLWSAHGVHQL